MEKGKLKFIYWFAYYNLDSPSVRYRAKYPLDFAKTNLDISSRLVIPGYTPKRLLHFIRSYISALIFPKNKSLIVIQRVRSNFIYSNLLKLLVKVRKKYTVYDLDDADYLEHNSKRIHFFARNCNFVSAGSDEIAKHMRTYSQNVIHVTSPTPDLGITKHERNKVFTIGWVGNLSRKQKESLFKYLFPAIKNLNFDCKLVLIGVTKESDKEEVFEYFNNCSTINVNIPDFIDYKDETALQRKIVQFDVGVATLSDHPIQLAKSGIKAKQYMNNGVPVICNDLPENNNFVIDGHNGFVCSSASEFEDSLIELQEMTHNKYRELSRNARDSTKHFDHSKFFEQFEKMKTSLNTGI